MAISEDTAALVAAQLTVAYATKMGERQGRTTHTDVKAELLETYLHFKGLVAERNMGRMQKVPIAGA